jgi:hypothetical protein
MRQPRARGWLAIALACCVLALTACNSNPEPTVEPPSPKPKKTTPSATPTAPSPSASPGEPAEHTFIRHYFSLVDYARKTGDVEPMLAASSPECKSCEGVAEVIRKVFDAGGHYEGSYDLEILEINGTGGAEINLVARSGKFRMVPASRGKAETYAAEQKFYVIELKRQGDQWIMYGYAVAE